MSVVHLVGGGRDESLLHPSYARFVADAAAAASVVRPRVHVLLVLEPDDVVSTERFRAPLETAGADAVVHAIVEGGTFDPAVLDGAQGLFVGGGLTPAYATALAGVAPLVRAQVSSGVPYLGFSAGAAIAADRALVGGFRLRGVAVCDEDAGEELDELTVVDGLGLVPFSVDVHAAQWGTVSRLIAAADAGLVASGYAIDEHTAAVVRDGVLVEIEGSGSAWEVRGGTDVDGVRVTRRASANHRFR